jgi:hypothetical protein
MEVPMKQFICGVAVGLAVLAVAGAAWAGDRGSGRRGLFGGPRRGQAARWHSMTSRPVYWSPPVVVAEAPSAEQEEPEAVTQTRRYLKVKNDTGSKLTVWLHYRTLTTGDEWKWFPKDGRKAVRYELDPGEETYLCHEGWKVNASRVRIWAETASGEQMDEYKDQDLWLVPEDEEGERSYSAPQMEDFTFAFSSAGN